MPMTKFVPDESFEEYRERFKEHFVMERSDDGVLEVRMHTNDGEAIWSSELHRAIGQLFEAVGADRENELMIFTGTGENWLRDSDGESFDAIELDEEVFKRASYEVWWRDGLKLQENLIWDIDIPTIAVINGPGFHTEFALLFDITICSEHTRFMEPHLQLGLAPGDAQFLVFQQLMGLKRANYAMYTIQPIDAEKALEWGMVNEVLPGEQLMPRARELAGTIMETDAIIRKITNHIIKRPWRRLLTDDFQMHFGFEMWGALVHRNRHATTPLHESVDRRE